MDCHNLLKYSDFQVTAYRDFTSVDGSIFKLTIFRLSNIHLIYEPILYFGAPKTPHAADERSFSVASWHHHQATFLERPDNFVGCGLTLQIGSMCVLYHMTLTTPSLYSIYLYLIDIVLNIKSWAPICRCKLTKIFVR
jgi:hypothetical protein